MVFENIFEKKKYICPAFFEQKALFSPYFQ